MEKEPEVITSIGFKRITGERAIMISEAIEEAFSEDENELIGPSKSSLGLMLNHERKE